MLLRAGDAPAPVILFGMLVAVVLAVAGVYVPARAAQLRVSAPDAGTPPDAETPRDA